ncbi:MAG: enoyl-CoA hydratase-related protein, partial [Paracoccaceae bacterium]
MTEVVAYAKDGAVALITVTNPPVNALSQAVRQGLLDRLFEAEADTDVQAIVLMGEGRAFIAGADIKEFGKTPLEPWLPDVCTRIEACPKLVIASMHGVSLGGGLEVALGAHYRVAVPSARVGLPEVHLGLIPGAGGTQRVPRLTGVEAALDIITSGRHVGAQEAHDMGLIDKIADGTPLENGLSYARHLLDSGAKRRAVSEMDPPPAIDWDATYDTVLVKGRGQISPAEAVRAVQACVELPFAEGI